MSRAEMSRMRIAATKAMNELDTKLSAAFAAGSPDHGRLQTEYNKAVTLEAAAGEKEEEAVLNSPDPNATVKLSSAASKLQAEVDRLKQSTAHLKQLGDALKAGKKAVDLF